MFVAQLFEPDVSVLAPDRITLPTFWDASYAPKPNELKPLRKCVTTPGAGKAFV